jgi:NADPH2:quinone reductase
VTAAAPEISNLIEYRRLLIREANRLFPKAQRAHPGSPLVCDNFLIDSHGSFSYTSSSHGEVLHNSFSPIIPISGGGLCNGPAVFMEKKERHVMQYIDIKEPGGPEVLRLREGAAPEPRDGEVLIQVAAAGVNRPDVSQRRGTYPPPPGASPVLGLEVAGVVTALGKGSGPWQIGDRVCALANGGGYAQYVAVPATQCLPVPAGLSMLEAAALPETCFTVWTNVFDRARLEAGESFLVHGGGSGIGTTAIQMARAFGARVFTTAGSDEKCRACENLGADIAINYRTQDFVAEILAATNNTGVNVILDMVGGDYIPRNIKAAAMDGRIVSIAFLHGSTVEADFMPMMTKRLTLTGSTLRPRSAEIKAVIARALGTHVWPLIESGDIRPLIAASFPLAEAASAHRLMEGSTHIGKIVLTVDDQEK